MPNKFFGSKLNSVLLLALIILMVFALRIMLKDKETYLPNLSESEESMGWQKAAYYNTPEGLPELTFNYAEGLRIEQNENQEPNTLTFSLIDIEKEKKVLNGEEKEFFLITTDIINLCYIGPNCFSNLPDVYKKYDFPGNEPLVEIGKMQYGLNEYTIYEESTKGFYPIKIYTLRIGSDRILGIYHFGDSEPPSTIDLESVSLIEK